MGHEGRWAQAGSSAQPGSCRVCSLETRSAGLGEASESLTNSPSLCLHSHSGAGWGPGGDTAGESMVGWEAQDS